MLFYWPSNATLNNPTLNNSTLNNSTTDLEAQIDELVYALYGLTEEEIALVAG